MKYRSPLWDRTYWLGSSRLQPGWDKGPGMACNYCGADNPVNASYCGNCGWAFDALAKDDVDPAQVGPAGEARGSNPMGSPELERVPAGVCALVREEPGGIPGHWPDTSTSRTSRPRYATNLGGSNACHSLVGHNGSYRWRNHPCGVRGLCGTDSHGGFLILQGLESCRLSGGLPGGPLGPRGHQRAA